MDNILNRFKLSTRILLLGLAVIFCFLLIFAWLYPKLKSNLYAEKYLKTRHLVESAWSIADFHVKMAGVSGMSEDEARKRAKAAIENMRYEKTEYFWINDLSPKMIMHPMNADLNGKDLSETKDPNGKKMFVEMAEICKREGQGFVQYDWPKPGEPEPLPKISYVKLLPQWGWVIGSGIYVDDVEKEMASLFVRIFGFAGGIALFSILLSYGMSRSISSPITRFAESLDQGAEQVASASSQISATSQSLAEGASEQAAAIEETSSSLEEMSSMTRRNADNAGQADHLMKDAGSVIHHTTGKMTELTHSMKEISKASEETSKIIKTIDEIAFQTNLLALNAAVEAARAGEAGAGFAVVADEVRNLAMRAADAAKNTAGLIEGTVRKIKEGSEIVAKTSETFGQVADSAVKVGDLVAEISAASREQAQGIEQVNLAVVEMDKVVQNNAASAEESASAAEEMNAQAEQMKSMIVGLMALIKGNQNKNISRGNGPYHDVNVHRATFDAHAPLRIVAGNLKNKKPVKALPAH